MKKNKIITGLVCITTLSAIFLGTHNSIVEAAPIKDLPMVEVPNKNSVVDEKYEVVAEFIKGKTTSKYFGVKPVKNNLGTEVILDPPDNLKGKIGKTWTNVGLFKGKQLDMKWTIMDWKKAGFQGGEYIKLGDTDISISTGGYGYNSNANQPMRGVKIKGEFIDHATGKVATDVKGNFMNFVDVDALQGYVFDKEATKKIAKIFVSNDSWIDGELLSDGRLVLKEPNNGDGSSNDEFAMFTTLFDGNTFTFDWIKDYGVYNKNRVIDWKNDQFSQYSGYTSKKLARTEIATPTKLVSDLNEKLVTYNTIQTYDEVFSYDITHRVPNEKSIFYYQSYVLTDSLISELSEKKVSITNEAGKDMMYFFTKKTQGNTIKYEATKEALKSAAFYGHDYRLKIDVGIKAGANLDKYKDEKGKIQLPNTAKSIVNGQEKTTQKVETAVPNLIKSKAAKRILNKEGKEVTAIDLNIGETVTFKQDFNISNEVAINRLELYDDLEQAFDVDKSSIKIMMGTTDVTSKGKLTVNEDKEIVSWVATTPTEFIGKKLTSYIGAKIKDVDFSDWSTGMESK